MYQEAGKWGRKFRWLDGAPHANSFDRERLDVDWQQRMRWSHRDLWQRPQGSGAGRSFGDADVQGFGSGVHHLPSKSKIANGEGTPERVVFYRDTFDVVPPHLGHLLADSITSEEAVAMKTKLRASAVVYRSGLDPRRSIKASDHSRSGLDAKRPLKT
jgi:hypothetical protein